MNKKLFIALIIFFVLIRLVSTGTVEGDTITGRVIGANGQGLPNITVHIVSTTLNKQCSLFGGCYCYAPRCSVTLTTLNNGTFNTLTDNMKFNTNYTCNFSGGPNINVSSSTSCAPSGGPSYVDDNYDYLQAYTDQDAAVLWNLTYNSTNIRYEYSDLQICNVSNITCNAPLLTPIPNQSGSTNTSWIYNLTPHMDTTSNREWKIKGLNPIILNISIDNNNLAHFLPKNNKYGYDKVSFELTNTQNNITSSQEITVFINKTLHFKAGWNLFSLPTVENNSVQHVLSPLSNGNWGCGHNSTNPYECNPSQGDFDGNWTILWAQKSPNNFEYFWPRDYYKNIPNQEVQFIDPHYGYWLRVQQEVDLPINYR